MSDAQKIKSVERQVRQYQKGKIASITCPWCKTENSPLEASICCPTFALAATAVVERQETMTRIDYAAQVAEMAARN